jgi:hypothetical protein
MDRFFGGHPAMVFLRLAIISMVVGIVLAALGLDAFDVFDSVKRLVVRIYEMGFEAFDWVLRYFFLGAVLVFPIWFIARLLKVARDPDKQKQ